MKKIRPATRTRTIATVCLYSALSFLLTSHSYAADPAACTPIIGFGQDVTGGHGTPTYTVTNLNDSGPGSLRDALSQSNRTVVFSVSGTVNLQSNIWINAQANMTIDGFSAPGNGITVDGSATGNAIIINNSNNIIVRGIRIQNSGNDNLQITSSSDLVITRNTFSNAGDGTLDVTTGVTDITISWNIIADTGAASLIKYNNPRRFTIHNNLYAGNSERNPLFDNVTDFDYFNNVIYDYASYGILLTNGASGNLIGNYFISTSKPHAAIWKMESPPFYLAGYRPNVDPSSTDEFPNVLPDQNWTRSLTEDWASFMASSPFEYGYPVTYTTAEQALLDVLSFAGPPNRTAQEDNYINEVVSATGVDPGIVACNAPGVFTNSFEDVPPSVPTNVAAQAASSTSIDVSWDPSSDGQTGIDHYNVYRDGIKVGESTGVDFADVGLQPSTLYSYQVSAVNGTSVESDLSSPAALAATFPPPVVAHWTFEEGAGDTTADVTGNGHDGTLINGAAWTAGAVGSHAVEFDGIDDHINAGVIDVAGSAITLSAWFLADDLASCGSADCRILSKASGTSDQQHFFMLSTVASGGADRLRFRLKTDGNTDTLVGDDGSVNDGQWYHVVAVYDGAEMILYQDAVVVGRRAKTGEIDVNPSVQTWIGSNPPNATSRPWAGRIDDVRIYGRALSEAEVVDLYNG